MLRIRVGISSGRPDHNSPNPEYQTTDIEQYQNQIGARNLQIEIDLLRQSPFFRHVEFATVRSKQSDCGWPRNIPGQHGLIDLPPEGVAHLTLDPGVRQGAMEQVWQHVQGDRRRRGIDDVSMED